MLIGESESLIFRTELFLFFKAKPVGTKKDSLLEFNALHVDISHKYYLNKILQY